jgi:16S rRNA (guanine527-N7)-methyltransferase
VGDVWLETALEESRALGYVGPGPIDDQIRHAGAFVSAFATLTGRAPTRFLDLGAGGGLPGLVLAATWRVPATLLEAMARRAQHLREVAEREGAPPGLAVLEGRAEERAREPGLESAFELVVARSFGPPATTAECAARFISPDGWLLVADPPGSVGERWPLQGLGVLGLEPVAPVPAEFAVQAVRKVAETPAAYPRRNGTPRKRPLF